MKKITKTAACHQAQFETSWIFPCGTQYKWRWFDHRANAWRESGASDFHCAQFNRRRHLIERAMEILHPAAAGWSPYEPGDFLGGKWQSYVS